MELGYSRLRRVDQPPRLAVFITNMRFYQKEDFGYDILVGFRKLAEPAGYQVSIIPLDKTMEGRIRYDQYMMKHNFKGALFLGLSLDHPWLEEFRATRYPTVLYDNSVSGNPRVTYVGADNRDAMLLAVSCLKALGHRKIGYLSSALGAYIYQQRHAAFFQALEDQGLPAEPELAKVSLYPDFSAGEHLPELIGLGCTAVICSHDLLAARALEECRERGIRVPEDLSVLGFDDLPLCETTVPPLTTIRQDRTAIGKSAFCALLSQIQGVPLSTFLLHTELIRRGSCGPR